MCSNNKSNLVIFGADRNAICAPIVGIIQWFSEDGSTIHMCSDSKNVEMILRVDGDMDPSCRSEPMFLLYYCLKQSYILLDHVLIHGFLL